jgi:hypothetical protein
MEAQTVRGVWSGDNKTDRRLGCLDAGPLVATGRRPEKILHRPLNPPAKRFASSS